MANRFGLEFRVVDSQAIRDLRRSRGIGANPFTTYPRLIVSIDWLKRERGMRLLGDVLPPSAHTYPRRFDLLIVDEVHTCAPAGRGKYGLNARLAALPSWDEEAVDTRSTWLASEIDQVWPGPESKRWDA